MIETLVSVGVGGLIGVASTVAAHVMQHRKEREMQRRKEVLPIASRVLAAAQQAWGSSRRYFSSTTGLTQGMTLMGSNTEARNQLLLALDELALLIPEIEEEALDLFESVSINSQTSAKKHEQRAEDYLDATTALQERVREILKTNK